MPTMASITVKKFDGTTDIVFDQLQGSGGDSSPAIWRQDTGQAAGLPVGLRPIFRLFGGWNGPKTARVLRGLLRFPYAVQDSTTTLYSAKSQAQIDITVTVPQDLPATQINEATYQAMNLVAAALVKQSMAAGYPPN
jgi:hypothetical protein